MFKKYSVLLFLFLYSSLGIGQQEKYTDSISKVIRNATTDSLKSTIFYNSGFFAIRKFGNLELFRVYIDSSMHYAKGANHNNLIAKSHFAYGVLERLEGNYDKAIDHLDKNIAYFKNDSLNKSYALFQKGAIYRKIGDLNNSLKTNLDILKIFKTKKDSFAIASTLNSIASIYGEMNNYDEAIENYTKARNIFINKNEQRDICATNLNIAVIYYRIGRLNKASSIAQDALRIALKGGFKDQEGRALSTLGTIYTDINSEKALRYFIEAKEILDQTNFVSNKVATNRGLGKVYYTKKKYSEAKKILIPTLLIAEENKILHEVQPLTKILADIAVKEANFELAYNYRLKYNKAKDSIFFTENSKNINLLQKQFETEKKDKEIAEQKLVLAGQELALSESKSKTRTMSILIISLLLASILLWFVFQQRQKRIQQQLVTIQREHEVHNLESLMEGEEKERLRIAKELHDGVNGDLAAIKFKLSSLLEMNNTVIKEAVTMIDNSCEHVRAISHNLVPPSLKDFNLIEAIYEYCQSMNDIHKHKIGFQYLGDAVELDKKQEANLFRIAQELVTNSIKHSDGSVIDVQLSYLENILQLTVEDNGKGFDPKVIKNDGIGLQNVQSRVDYLNATIDFLSNDKGTSYTIVMDTKTSTT